MEGVRGQEKNPGEFRRSQNWIGPQGGSLKNAVFVPPTRGNMEKSMTELEKFMNEQDEMDPQSLILQRLQKNWDYSHYRSFITTVRP